MRVVDIARGMLTGYGLRLLQIFATLLVVPYLLRDDMLGIDDYGRVYSILGALSLIALLTDGLKAAFARVISRSLSDDDASTGRVIGSAAKIMTAVCSIATIVLVVAHREFLELLAIPVEFDYRAGWILAVLAVVLENALFILTSLLTARGRMDVMNVVLAFEVIGRNAVFVGWFHHFGASLTAYFSIYLAGVAIRMIAVLVYATTAWRGDFQGFWSGRIADSAEAVRYSFSLSLSSVNYFVFQRLSIPLTARFIGPAEAGMLAIALNTIANNLSQVIFNVARPLLIPVASRIRFDRLSESRARLLLDVDGLYTVLVCTVTAPMIAFMPTLIEVWLGAERSVLVVPAQILIAGATIQVGFNVRRALLVGQGLAAMIARVSLVCGALGLPALYWALVEKQDWWWVAVVIALVGSAASAIGIGIGFDKVGLLPDTARPRRGLRALFVMAVSLGTAAVLSRSLDGTISIASLAAPLVAVLVTLGCSQLVLTGFADARSTFVKLRKGSHRSIVDSSGQVND